jgi:hypothetical protein
MLRFCDAVGFCRVFCRDNLSLPAIVGAVLFSGEDRAHPSREENTNGGAATELAFRFDPAAMQLRDVFDDGKTETGATEFAAACFIDPIKPFENPR